MDARMIADAVVQSLNRKKLIQIEVSARHVHLCETAMKQLFGEKAALTPKRELSQTGQFLAAERVNLIGAKGKKENVAVLGPLRNDTQVELSQSDCLALGVKAPVRQSGDVKGSGAILLEGPNGTFAVEEGVIIAQNHIHMTPDTAKEMGLIDQQRVTVETFGMRKLTYHHVLIRVHESFRTRMHIDFDEANAALIQGFALGQILD